MKKSPYVALMLLAAVVTTLPLAQAVVAAVRPAASPQAPVPEKAAPPPRSMLASGLESSSKLCSQFPLYKQVFARARDKLLKKMPSRQARRLKEISDPLVLENALSEDKALSQAAKEVSDSLLMQELKFLYAMCTA